MFEPSLGLLDQSAGATWGRSIVSPGQRCSAWEGMEARKSTTCLQTLGSPIQSAGEPAGRDGPGQLGRPSYYK